MHIQGITLRELSMKLVTPFETSMDRLEVRRIILLEADVDGVTGWGECVAAEAPACYTIYRSEEHTSELQSQSNLVCRLQLEKKKQRVVAPVSDLVVGHDHV